MAQRVLERQRVDVQLRRGDERSDRSVRRRGGTRQQEVVRELDRRRTSELLHRIGDPQVHPLTTGQRQLADERLADLLVDEEVVGGSSAASSSIR